MSDKTIQTATVGTVQPGALTAIARKEDFLQHLQDFLDTHKTEKWCVAAIDVEHFRLYNELYGTEQGNALLNTLASHLLDYQKTSGCPVGYWGNDDFFLCLPDDRVQQQDIVITLQTCVNPNHQDVTGAGPVPGERASGSGRRRPVQLRPDRRDEPGPFRQRHPPLCPGHAGQPQGPAAAAE